MALLNPSSIPRRPRYGALQKICLLLGWLAVAVPAPVPAQEDQAKVKAAFAYNFTQHITWPTNLFAGAQAPIIIGVLGDAPLGDLIEKTAAGKLSQGRPVVVRRCGRVEDLAGCHLVFLRQTDRRRQLEILTALRGKPVLTVCDSDSFFGLGVAVKLLIRPDTSTGYTSVGFWVNRWVAEQSGIKLGARMLQCADKIVDAPSNPK